MKNGIWKKFDEEGKLVSKGLYENNLATGKWLKINGKGEKRIAEFK